jgi:hypothetical protein
MQHSDTDANAQDVCEPKWALSTWTSGSGARVR